MGRYRRHRPQQGQSIVEFALILPLLLLFLIGTAEVGYAFYSYISMAGANREGVRLASRGRFPDNTVAARIVAAGGSYEPTSGVVEPFLRTLGPTANTGIIISRLDIAPTGQVLAFTTYATGTLTLHLQGGAIDHRPIAPEDTRLTPEQLARYVSHNAAITGQINQYRNANDYDMIGETLVIVETFFAHDSLTGIMSFFEDPLTLYFVSTMRVMYDSRMD